MTDGNDQTAAGGGEPAAGGGETAGGGDVAARGGDVAARGNDVIAGGETAGGGDVAARGGDVAARANDVVAGGGIPVTGVSELVLEVVDLDAAEAFYAGVLGLPVVDRWTDREAIWVMAGERTRIGLWRPQVGLAGGRGGIHVHFAMHIAEADYDAAVARLKERGAYREEHAFATYEASRAVYAEDPDGNVVELWTWDVGNHLRQRS